MSLVIPPDHHARTCHPPSGGRRSTQAPGRRSLGTQRSGVPSGSEAAGNCRARRSCVPPYTGTDTPLCARRLGVLAWVATSPGAASAGCTSRCRGGAGRAGTRYYCYAIDESISSVCLLRRARSGLGLTAGGTPAAPGAPSGRTVEAQATPAQPARLPSLAEDPALAVKPRRLRSCPAAAAGGCSPPGPSASQAPVETFADPEMEPLGTETRRHCTCAPGPLGSGPLGAIAPRPTPQCWVVGSRQSSW
jgi:hypothetical protein